MTIKVPPQTPKTRYQVRRRYELRIVLPVPRSPMQLIEVAHSADGGVSLERVVGTLTCKRAEARIIRDLLNEARARKERPPYAS